MYNEIKNLLEAGMTPEAVYQEALRMQEARNAAKVKLEEKKIAEARKKLEDSLMEYVELIVDDKVSTDFRKELEENLKQIEGFALHMKKEAEKEESGKRPQKKKSDEEKIIDFLRSIGAMA